MSVQLNHTIVACHDQQRSAAFLTGILGLPPASRFGHFLVVEADNGVSLDFSETSGEIASQHYAFLVGEEEFDAAFGRIRERDLAYWADPGQTRRGEVRMCPALVSPARANRLNGRLGPCSFSVKPLARTRTAGP